MLVAAAERIEQLFNLLVSDCTHVSAHRGTSIDPAENRDLALSGDRDLLLDCSCGGGFGDHDPADL